MKHIQNYTQAKDELTKLFEKYADYENEAEVRFHFIDEFLEKCLLWSRHEIVVEKYEDGGRTDYELGKPRQVIVEAKKDSIDFNIPCNRDGLIQIKQLIDHSKEAKSTIEQVQTYCSHRGVKNAVILNGVQLICFIAIRTDGISPLDGLAYALNGHKSIYHNFDKIFEFLTPEGIKNNTLSFYLNSQNLGIPEKLSSQITTYRHFRYSNEHNKDLQLIAELVLEDISKNNDIENEKQFYQNCYCETGPLSQDALVGKKILSARYAALFPHDENDIALTPIKDKKGQISNDIFASSLAKRPVVLIGDVGVGKTSFIKNLILREAAEEFKKSIWIYIDLGTTSFLDTPLKELIPEKIKSDLLEKYEININSSSNIKYIYEKDINTFDESMTGQLKEINPEKYQEKLISFLDEKISKTEIHLEKAINFISKSMRKQVIIILDNVDQRDFSKQQEAFIIAQSIAEHWNCIVFLSVRPNTFHNSKRSGAFSAYPNKLLYIMPPRPDHVLEKRLIYALNIAEGNMEIDRLKGVSINLQDIACFIKALLFSIRNNRDITEFLSNITGGNIRLMIDLITKFIGSSNIDSDKIIKIQQEKGSYIIPLHEFTKAALLGEYSYYDSESSIAMNIYDVKHPDPKEHFLVSLILGYLNHDSSSQDKDGFILMDNIYSELQNLGYIKEQIDNAIRRMVNKKLIDAPGRMTFEENIGELKGELQNSYRITTVGAYHLKRWGANFAYLDGIIFDTPIFDSELRNKCIEENLESFDIRDRYSRITKFKNYLTSIWELSQINVPYYSWHQSVQEGKASFESVEKYISKQQS